MDHQRLAAMAEATRLTSQGRLTEATALIQRTLNGLPGDATAGAHRLHRGPALTQLPGAPSLPHLQNLQAIPGLSRLRSDRWGIAPAIPSGADLPGETLVRSYGGRAGERPYTLYVPSRYTGDPVPLVVMLHGGTQNAAEFAAASRMSELAEEHTFLVVYPEQVVSANPMRCWNWFLAADQHRGSGEPSLIAGITSQLVAELFANRDRVYVAGFSAGAAMAAVMAATYPDLFSAVGVHSGLAYGAAHDVTSAFAAMQHGPQGLRRLARSIPLITFHGDADTVVSPVNAVRVVEQFTPPGTATTTTTPESAPDRRSHSRIRVWQGGRTIAERWTVHGSGHAWSGGVANGSYTDPQGPDASAEMVRFFAEHARCRP